MKAKKLCGKPSVMVPADLLLILIRTYNQSPTVYLAELSLLEARAYRKVKEAK